MILKKGFNSKIICLFCLTCLFYLFCFGSLAFAVETASTNSEELKSLLQTLTTLQATFQQTVKSEKGKFLQRLSGNVWLKKPAQFRWEVLGKEYRLVVANGKRVWDYDRELEQVIVQKLNQGQTKAPIFFLTGNVNGLDKDFKISKLPLIRGVCLSQSDTCFELKPKQEDGSFHWIKVGFKGKQLKEMQMLDQLGQLSQFIFNKMVLNATIPAEQFSFTPPKGVDVLRNE